MSVNKRMKKSTCLVLILILAAFLSACASNSPEENPTPVPVEDFTVPLYFQGRVISKATYELSFPRQGNIETVTVQIGDEVDQGDTLAVLDTQNILNEIQVAEVKLSLAEANLQLVNQQFANPNAGQISVAQAQYDEAQLNLEIAQRHLDETKITAPIDGTITHIYTLQYEYAFAGQPVIQIKDLDSLSVELEIDIFDLGETEVGDSAAISFDNLTDVEVEGVVRSILPNEDDDRGGLYVVIIDLLQQEEGVDWGLSANVLFGE